MKRVNVTKSFLPPIKEYEKYLKQIWENEQLTNQGPILQEFEQQASEYLGVKNFHFVTNGTIALQIALRALDITEGEIITTPFSYVATTSAILWERCTPVFVDIKPDSFCIDSDKIEAAITPNTKAIMPVHVFGNACDVEKIEQIAKEYNLKVIYDAAHAFGVRYKGNSLLNYGDISTCSFHATKLFHTIEGGAVVVNQKTVSNKVELLKRFGHDGDSYKTLGINAKASEFQAAMGLCNLKYIDGIRKRRKQLSEYYDTLLGSSVQKLVISPDIEFNYSYYPVVFSAENALHQKTKSLADYNIHPRRYFYPSLNELTYLKSSQSCPISESISRKVLCLPLHAELSEDVVEKVCKVINS